MAKVAVGRLAALISTALLVSACAGGASQFRAGALPEPQPPREAPVVVLQPGPDGASVLLPALPENGAAPSRFTSANGVDTPVVTAPAAYSPGVGPAIDDPGALAVIPVDDGNPDTHADEWAYATYSISGRTLERPKAIHLTVSPALAPGGDDLLPLRYWVGLSDYTQGQWYWLSQGSTDPDLGFSVVQNADGSRTLSFTMNSVSMRERFTSISGKYHILVATGNLAAYASSSNETGACGVKVKACSVDIEPNANLLPTYPHVTPISSIDTGNLAQASSHGKSTATATGEPSATLQWDHLFDPDNDKCEAVSYGIYRQLWLPIDQREVDKVSLAQVQGGGATKQYVDPNEAQVSGGNAGPVPGAQYVYYLRAFGNDGWSAFSQYFIDVPLLPPADFNASDGTDNKIALSWTAQGHVLEYGVWREVDLSDQASYPTPDDWPAPLAVVAGLPAGQMVNWTDAGVGSGETHSYRVCARNEYAVRPGNAEGWGRPSDAAQGLSAADIWGVVSLGSGGPVLPGVTVTLSGIGDTLTDETGRFEFFDVPAGPHVLTPQLVPYTFQPPTADADFSGAMVRRDFVADDPGNSVSGRITRAGAGAAGVSLTLAPGGLAAETNADGYFVIPSVPDGDYTLSPQNGDWSFNPGSLDVTVAGADVPSKNFTVRVFSIKGTVSKPGGGAGGITVSAGNGESAFSTTTDGAGQYTIAGVPDGTYTVTPAKGSWTFDPAQSVETVSGAGLTGVDFSVLAYTLSGVVELPDGSGLAGVALSDPTLGTVTSAGTGAYTFEDVPAGSYLITPALGNWSFAPAQRAVSVTDSDRTGLDFVASQPPVAEFESSRQWGFAPLSIEFDGSGSSDPDGGSLTAFDWDWAGDGSYDLNGGSDPTASNTYEAIGHFAPRLRVTDEESQADEVSGSVDVPGWCRSWRHSGANNTYCDSAVADSSGNVYLVGTTNHDPTAVGVVLKYAPDGDLQWAKQWSLTSTPTVSEGAVALHPSGGIVAAFPIIYGGQYKTLLLRVNAAGALLDSKFWNWGTQITNVNSLDIDNDGRMLLNLEGKFGYGGASGRDCALVLLDDDYTQVWGRVIGRTNWYIDMHRAILSSSGEVYSCSEQMPVGGSYWTGGVYKLDAAGSLLWTAEFSKASTHGVLRGLAERDGYIFAAGYNQVVKFADSDTLPSLAGQWDISATSGGGDHLRILSLQSRPGWNSLVLGGIYWRGADEIGFLGRLGEAGGISESYGFLNGQNSGGDGVEMNLLGAWEAPGGRLGGAGKGWSRDVTNLYTGPASSATGTWGWANNAAESSAVSAAFTDLAGTWADAAGTEDASYAAGQPVCLTYDPGV